MKMTGIEKLFINRKKQAVSNIAVLNRALTHVDMEGIKSVLELGCGTGRVSMYMAEFPGLHVRATDYDISQIEKARILHNTVSEHLVFQKEDAAKLSFKNSSFDLIIAQNIFHHIPAWDRAAKEMARVLQPGGYAVWLDIAFPLLVKMMFLPLVKNYGLYTIEDIEETFKTYGFSILNHDRLSKGLMKSHQLVLRLT